MKTIFTLILSLCKNVAMSSTHIAKKKSSFFCFRWKLIAHFFYYQKPPLNSIYRKHNYKHLSVKPFKTIFVCQPLITVVCCTLTYYCGIQWTHCNMQFNHRYVYKSSIKASKRFSIYSLCDAPNVRYIPTHRKFAEIDGRIIWKTESLLFFPYITQILAFMIEVLLFLFSLFFSNLKHKNKRSYFPSFLQ